VVACNGVAWARGRVLAEHGAGSGEHEEKNSRRCRAPMVGVAAARPWSRWGGDPPNGCGLRKRTRGMLCPRVVGEGIGMGNGESVSANAMTMTSWHTNVAETNQRPAFFVYRTEVRMHPHA